MDLSGRMKKTSPGSMYWSSRGSFNLILFCTFIFDYAILYVIDNLSKKEQI